MQEKCRNAFQGFLSQVRSFLFACLPWIVVLDARGMEQRLCRGDGQPSISCGHAGIYHGAHHHTWPWAATACQSSILASGTSQVAEVASADGVVSCWPRGLNWLLILYGKPEAAPWAQPVSEGGPGPSAWHNLFPSLLYPVPSWQQRKFCWSPRQETGPPRSGAQPQVGSLLDGPSSLYGSHQLSSPFLLSLLEYFIQFQAGKLALISTFIFSKLLFNLLSLPRVSEGLFWN